MVIDIRTIILIIGISSVLQVIVLYNQYKTNKYTLGPGWWLMWSIAEILGFFLILLRTIPSFIPVAIIFQDPIILLGPIFIYTGIVRFFKKKVNLKFIVPFFVSFVVLHLFFFFVKDSFVARTMLFDAYQSAIMFLSALTIYKNKPRSLALTANFNIVVLIVHGIVFSLLFFMLLFGINHTDVFTPNIYNILQYFDGLIIGLLLTFGVIIMLNQKLNVEISEVKAHFEQIFNTSPDAAVISRLSDGMFVDCNEGFTKLSGYTKEEVLDKSSLFINIWKNPTDRAEVVRKISEKGFFENFEFQFQLKNGEVITGLMSGKIITLKDDLHIISVTRDISERKIAEQTIKLKNDELLKLNAEKDKFYSILSHDLLGPFHNFLGLTQIMEEELTELTMDELKKLSMSLKSSAANLFSLLENLLNWSKIQRGLIPFNPQLFQLQSIISEGLVAINESAKAKGIDITLDIPDDLRVNADNIMLQTVIRNLVSNAVKFTYRSGKIHLSSKYIGDTHVEISIKDSGIGMNPSIVSNLFKLDVQTNRKGTDGEPSSGLGLLLCKEFVDKHGGHIWVESEEGKGSKFSFTIPN